jgi:transketolase
MSWSPEQPDHPAADRLVLSEGHACPIVYAAGADPGISIDTNGGRRPMEDRDLGGLRSVKGALDGHADPAEGFPFFPAATGSLGQGLSIANGYVQTGRVSRQQSAAALAAKLAAFGVEAVRIDGHDPEQIEDALRRHDRRSLDPGATPIAIVAQTVKGWGSPILQDSDSGHHGKPATGEELERALGQLMEEGRRLGAEWEAGAVRRAPFDPPPIPRKDVSRGRERAEWPGLMNTLRDLGRREVLEKRELAPRKAFGLALRTAGLLDATIVALDGDVSNSTYVKEFSGDPDLAPRFFECRIAEQNMVSCAVGLALSGKVPVAASFGKFLSRAYDQFEMGIVGRANLKLVGSHVGVSPAADGPSQMSLPDAAFFRSLSGIARKGDGEPMVHVLTPADAVSAYRLTHEMLRHEGPCYLRVMRTDVPFLHEEETPFRLGGHRVLADGKDLVIAAWGTMVHEALKAREKLAEEGASAAVLDLYCLPFDESAIRDEVHRRGGRALTVEDNYPGAVGSAVAEALAGSPEPSLLARMAVERVPRSGRSPAAVLEDLRLDAGQIAERALELVKRGPIGRSDD